MASANANELTPAEIVRQRLAFLREHAGLPADDVAALPDWPRQVPAVPAVGPPEVDDDDASDDDGADGAQG